MQQVTSVLRVAPGGPNQIMAPCGRSYKDDYNLKALI